MVYNQSRAASASGDDAWFVASVFGNFVLICMMVDNAYYAISVDGTEFPLQSIVIN